jgi:nanoRNase/pAp phosphatase (c-di-AMP/oligoRNAs hydrolase)
VHTGSTLSFSMASVNSVAEETLISETISVLPALGKVRKVMKYDEVVSRFSYQRVEFVDEARKLGKGGIDRAGGLHVDARAAEQIERVLAGPAV